MAQLHPLAEALRENRWWTGVWWRARHEGDVVQRLADLEKRRDELTAAHDRLTREIEEHTAERGQAEARFAEAAAQLRRREVERRRRSGRAGWPPWCASRRCWRIRAGRLAVV